MAASEQQKFCFQSRFISCKENRPSFVLGRAITLTTVAPSATIVHG